jgi:hypothetical protein
LRISLRFLFVLLFCMGARGSVVGWGTMLQGGRSPVRIPDYVDVFNLPNHSSRTMALGSTQPITEMSTRNLPGCKKRPVLRADNLAAICEPNVWNVGASTSRNPKGLRGLYRDSFTLPLHLLYECAPFLQCSPVFCLSAVAKHSVDGPSCSHYFHITHYNICILYSCKCIYYPFSTLNYCLILLLLLLLSPPKL